MINHLYSCLRSKFCLLKQLPLVLFLAKFILVWCVLRCYGTPVPTLKWHKFFVWEVTLLVPMTCHKPFNGFPTGMTIHVRVKVWFSLHRIVTQVLLALRGKGKSPKQTSQLQPSKYPIYSLHYCLSFVPRLVNRNGLISRPQKWPCWKYMKMCFLQGTWEICGLYKQ